MKRKHRYRRKGKGDGLIGAWPETARGPDELAERISYVGSNEHKTRPIDPSFDFSPALRSDASRCDPAIAREQAQDALREAVRRRCVSHDFVGEFPRYVWGWLAGRPHVARLENCETGSYKAWPIEHHELPLDREGRLAPPGAGA